MQYVARFLRIILYWLLWLPDCLPACLIDWLTDCPYVLYAYTMHAYIGLWGLCVCNFYLVPEKRRRILGSVQFVSLDSKHTICKRNAHLNARNDSLFTSIWCDTQTPASSTFCLVCINEMDGKFRGQKLDSLLIIYSTRSECACMCECLCYVCLYITQLTV